MKTTDIILNSVQNEVDRLHDELMDFINLLPDDNDGFYKDTKFKRDSIFRFMNELNKISLVEV